MFTRVTHLTITIFIVTLLLGISPTLASETMYQGKIGVITPLTGDMSQNGLTAQVAIELALHDFQLVHPDTSLELVIEDSRSDPTQAAAIAQKFSEQGIRIVVATGSSAEIEAIKPISDANGMIVIASTSTAPSLSMDDSIIRLTPTDFTHAQGMVEYLRYKGIDVVAPIYRNDVFGKDFMGEFRSRFQERGGSVTEGVAYDGTATDFSSYTAALSQQVEAAKQNDSSATVAVLTVAFGEIYSIFTAAANSPVLSTVGWYGTEDYARDERLDNDSVARSFALSVEFTHSLYSPYATSHPYTSMVQFNDNLTTRALKLNANVSETMLNVMFDSLWLAGILARDPDLRDVPSILATRFIGVGYSGAFRFDENGDRSIISYGFFRYVNPGNHPTWALVGSYKPSAYFTRPALSYREFIPDGQDKTLRVGLLFSLTGDNAVMGQSFARMAELAEEDIDALLQRKFTSNSKIEYVMANTESNPEVALAKIKEMKNQGIRFVVGPTNSAELEAIADFVNQNEMILISPCSTAVSLAKDDNIFRYTLDNSKQAYALAALLIQEGYKNVEGLYRNDTYGSELFSLFSAAFTEMGGRCGAGIPYDTGTKDFTSVVKSLETQVTNSLANSSAKETAILMISFDEGVSILETLASSQSFLTGLRWFSADAVAGNSAFLESSSALQTALQTRLTASLLGLEVERDIIGLYSQVVNSAQRLGCTPTAYDLTAYDAIWMFLLVAENRDWQFDAPFADLRSDFIAVANNTYIMHTLNDSGDLLFGIFNFYRIDSSTNPAWDAYAAYLFFYNREMLQFFEESSDSSASEWSLYR